MSRVSLEERVATRETLVGELMRRTDTPGHKKEWRRTDGMFEGDLIMQEITEEGQRIRKEDTRHVEAWRSTSSTSVHYLQR